MRKQGGRGRDSTASDPERKPRSDASTRAINPRPPQVLDSLSQDSYPGQEVPNQGTSWLSARLNQEEHTVRRRAPIRRWPQRIYCRDGTIPPTAACILVRMSGER